MEKSGRRIEVEGNGTLSALLGAYDANLAIVAEEFGVKAFVSGTDVCVVGDSSENELRAESAILNMLSFLRQGKNWIKAGCFIAFPWQRKVKLRKGRTFPR